MLIEIDDGYVNWVRQANQEMFVPGEDEKPVLEQYINEVLAKHRESWLAVEEDKIPS